MRKTTARLWHKENAERTLANTIAWRASNPDAVAVQRQRRRARLAKAEGDHTAAEWRDLKEQYGHHCLCCGHAEPDIVLSADHVIPLSRGGSNAIDNIQPLCVSCNARKHTKSIDYRPGWDA